MFFFTFFYPDRKKEIVFLYFFLSLSLSLSLFPFLAYGLDCVLFLVEQAYSVAGFITLFTSLKKPRWKVRFSKVRLG